MLVASLYASLQNGNIDSVTDFKLLLQHIFKGDNELFVTALLSELEFIVPTTFYVPSIFNGIKFIYIFQEKVRKELLETHRLREGPVLEGDKRFSWPNAEKHGANSRLYLAQKNLSDKILISGGLLKDWKIVFQGIKSTGNIKQQRFDRNLLTGCVTLLDVMLENISFVAKHGDHEDTVDLVGVKGSLNEISINDVENGGLDADFSSRSIESMKIIGAGNDCVDFPAGIYRAAKLNLVNCEDRAISVGESSTTTFTDLGVDTANTGLTVKDSSLSRIYRARFCNVVSCLVATRKKQEIWGSKISISKHRCPSNNNYQELGSLIEVTG